MSSTLSPPKYLIDVRYRSIARWDAILTHLSSHPIQGSFGRFLLSGGPHILLCFSAIVAMEMRARMSLFLTVVPFRGLFGEYMVRNFGHFCKQYVESLVSSLPWGNIDGTQVLRVNQAYAFA
jgi:hypothetical protein